MSLYKNVKFNNMKNHTLGYAILVLLFMACTKEEITSQLDENSKGNLKFTTDALVGKWAPTYLVKNGKGEFVKINTLVPLPDYEFTVDGKFLSDGKPGADCCGFVGNNYKVEEKKIKFSDFKVCPDVACVAMVCEGWEVNSIVKDTLTMTDCFSTSKYVKIK
jgi:hypothetical protein